jgi:starch-binding outer membrane protein SusE/F
MKKLSILILALVALTGFNACTSDDDVVFIANPDTDGIHFTNNFAASYDLTEVDPGDVVDRFVWSEVDFGVPTNINYELQASLTEDFDDPVTLGSTSVNNLDVTAQQLIRVTEDEDLEETNTFRIHVRVVASAGTAGEMAHISPSESFTIIVPTEPGFIHFYLVGDATAAGWNPDNNNTPLFRDGENENLFHFTGRFDGSGDKEGFKLLETLGLWQPQWGLDGDNLSNSTILGGDPSAFPVDADAYYTFTMNIDEMTYSFEAYDESGAPTFETIGFIGDATPGGWDNDTDMTKSQFDPHIWYAKNVSLSGGEMKFRANDDWTNNWGGETFPSGESSQDGPNIPVTAGTYDIWFNDLSKRYILIPQTED